MSNHNAAGRPKPLADHRRAGTFRNTRHAGQRNPTAPTGKPDPPEPLEAGARAAWDAAVAILDTMEIASTVDALALYQYARLYEETEQVAATQAGIRASAAALDATIPGLTGADLVAAAAAIAFLRKLESKCTDQLRQGRTSIRGYLVEFGLTPASRGRIRLPDLTEPVDAFAAFAAKRPA